MRIRVTLLRRIILPLVSTFVLTGAVVSPPALAAPGENVAIAPEALPQAVSTVLEQGRRLETEHRWADALAHYEQAIRLYPTSTSLEQRFDVARLHYSVERRYADSSFIESSRDLDAKAATALLDELLRKIDSHYVINPPWQSLAHRSVTGLEVALADEKFRQQNGLRLTGEQIDRFNRELQATLARRGSIQSRLDVAALADETARLAGYRVGLSPAAAILEFTAAVSEGLDHYSSYLTPSQLREIYSQIEGNFVGLGVELKSDNDTGALLIVRVIPNSPAESAGIRAGDLITAVDGKPTADYSTDEAGAMLTGEAGSIVRLEVRSTPVAGTHLVAKPSDGQRPASAPVRELSVRRDQVDVPSIEDAKIIDPQYGVAYARIPVFQKSTARDLDAALWDLHRQGMRSLVLDLRRNPGGLPTASAELADKFVAQGGIVSTRGRSEGEDFDYRAHRAGTWRVPLVVMIDGDSASASEIFAAAIRDNRRGTIVGVRSYGKGTVQGIFPLSYGGAGVRITTAKFLSPNGQPISKVGVEPDIVVRHATGAASGQLADEQADAALDTAVKAARQQVALR